MQGVLVSVSAVVYTRIVVSDRISACPYRPFSNLLSLFPRLQESIDKKLQGDPSRDTVKFPDDAQHSCPCLSASHIMPVLLAIMSVNKLPCSQ